MADDQLALDKESMTAGDPGAALATELGRQAAPREVKKITGADDYAALPAGSAYLDPQGQKRFKPIKTKEDYATIPEGEQYADPTGQLRTKPAYEGIDFTAQALYNIAHSDKGRRMALERSYPGKVKEDPVTGELYVDEDGKLRKPGRGISSATAFVASEAVPVALGAVGSALGGAVGTLAEPGGGTIVGGAAGAYGGGYMGQRINDIFAQLAGVYDPEGGEAHARVSGLASAAGDVGGRALFAVAPSVKEGVSRAIQGSAKAANKFLGTNPEKLEMGLQIAEQGEEKGLGLSKPGTAVSPSAIFESSPHLTNVAEILQQKFDKSDTYLANAERFMDRRAKEILASKDIGVLVEDSLVHPRAAVSTEKAGEALKTAATLRAVQKSAEADRMLNQLLEERRAGVQAKYAPEIERHRMRNEAVVKTAEQAKNAADNLVQEGFRDIEKQANDAFRVAQVGHNAGDLWRSVAESFVGLRRSIAERARTMYGNANDVSNGLVPPGSDRLAFRARDLMGQLPEGFAASHPTIIRRIAAMAGEVGENGEVVREPISATWSELHELRTLIRQDIKWNDLASDVRNGALKHMENGINETLHSVENQPELREASRLLRLADDFYRENMGPLNNTQIKSLVKALDSGLQADPKALLKVAIRDGSTEVAETIRRTVGPQTWDAMRAADVQEMLSQSRQLDGSLDGLKFAKQVEDRFQNGLLGVLHGRQGEQRLRQQALYVMQLRGKLPINPRPGDTAADIILRARSAAADAEQAAKTDPLKAMTNEMKKVEAAARKEFTQTQKPDELAFLANATVGAHEAVDKILKDPDLIVAAARAFPGGENSAEFKLLRQVWAERFLRTTLQPGKKLSAELPEVQQLMFPGVSLDDMHMLAKEMEFLMSGATMRRGGGDMGGSIMAQQAVENPLGRASGLGKLAGPAKMIPFANFVGRATLTAYYNSVRRLLTSPTTLRWLRKGLTSGSAEDRAAFRANLMASLQKGGMLGAGAGAGAAMTPGAESRPQ